MFESYEVLQIIRNLNEGEEGGRREILLPMSQIGGLRKTGRKLRKAGSRRREVGHFFGLVQQAQIGRSRHAHFTTHAK